MSDRPFWIIEKKTHHSELHYLSNQAKEQEFLNLKNSGYTGMDKHYFEDFSYVVPLLNLLNISPANKHNWIEHWKLDKESYFTRKANFQNQ